MKHKAQTISFQIVILLILIGISAFSGIAQPPPANSFPLSLSNKLDKYCIVSSDTPFPQLEFQVDKVTPIRFESIAHEPPPAGIMFRIVTPSGERIDKDNVGSYGGTYATYTVPHNTPLGSLMSVSFLPGTHYVFEFPTAEIGTYYYLVNQYPENINSPAIGVGTMFSNESEVGAGLIVSDTTVILGKTVNITAALFDGSTAVESAWAGVTVTSDSGTQTFFRLRDEGDEGDAIAGDGLYSGSFTPPANGEYSLFADLNGSLPSGIQFAKQGSANFKVYPADSYLTGVVNNTGIDENGDGLFENINFEAFTQTTAAGDYGVSVTLKTSQGISFSRSNTKTLEAGQGSIKVDFEADGFLSLGENGAYSIERVELIKYTENGAITMDVLENLGDTQAYQLSQMQREPIILTGQNTVAGIDINGNGKYEYLSIKIGVNVSSDGIYGYSGTLYDTAGDIIGIYGEERAFGAGTNSAEFIFDGREIFEHGVSGSFRLGDVIIWGNNNSIISNNLLETQAFNFDDFENTNDTPQIRFVGQPAYAALKQNSTDTTFRWLRIYSQLYVPATGSYKIKMVLLDPQRQEIETVEETKDLAKGINPLTTLFSSWEINAHGVSGSYIIGDVEVTRLSQTIPGPPTEDYLSVPTLLETEPFNFEQFTRRPGTDVNLQFVKYETTQLEGANYGDGDGIWEAGETVKLKVTLENLGIETARGVLGYGFQVTSGNAQVGTSFPSFPDIASGEEGSGDFIVQLDETAPPNSIVNFTVTVVYTASWTKEFVFSVRSGEQDALVYGNVENGLGRIYTINADGSSKTALLSGTTNDYDPEWSPNGNKIAFVKDNDLCTMSNTGTNLNCITPINSGGSPVWSPDNSQIAFIDDVNGNRDIFVIGVSGVGRTQITNSPANEEHIKWSPDETKIAFAREGKIYTINPDGTSETVISTGNSAGILAWSPDSSKIAWIEDLTRELFVGNADGSNATVITDIAETGGKIAWSPDSTKIAFSGLDYVEPYFLVNIFVVDIIGGTPVKITEYSQGNEPYQSNIKNVAWSPDGTRFVYSYLKQSGTGDGYVINADGSNRIRLLRNADENVRFEWKNQ